MRNLRIPQVFTLIRFYVDPSILQNQFPNAQKKWI